MTPSCQQNGLWFSLRLGSHRNKALQSCWTAHGEAAFRFEALEQLAPDTSAYLQRSLLKAQAATWRQRLGAV